MHVCCICSACKGIIVTRLAARVSLMEFTPMIGQIGFGESGGVPPVVLGRPIGSQTHSVSDSPVPNEASDAHRSPR